MLWTALSAVLMAVTRTERSTLEDIAPNWRLIHAINSAFLCVLTGGMLMGAATLLWGRIRIGLRLVSQPGHWLLLIFAAENASMFVVSLLVAPQLSIARLFAVHCLLRVAIVIALSCGAIFSESRLWKVAFLGPCLLSALQAGYWASLWAWDEMGFQGWGLKDLRTVTAWASFAAGLWITFFAIRDLQLKTRRDWLHWLGVGGYVAKVTAASLVLLVMRAFLD